MPSDQVKPLAQPVVFTPRVNPRRILPPLQPQFRIARPLSMPEYYHSSVGCSERTLEPTRENGFVLRGEGRLDAEQWQAALDQVAAANPGTRLRLIGNGRGARWDSDGRPPRLRIVENCSWDGESSDGTEFLYETTLPLETGPIAELLVVHQPDNRMLLILRSHHAAMDGMGCMHFFRELFHALRGERLLGTNSAYSDVDLMLSIGAKHSTSRHVPTTALTGVPQGGARGDEWRRVYKGPPAKNLLGRIAAAMAEFAYRHADMPVLIAVPVDLRRHVPGLLSTANYTNMLLVRMEKGEGAEHFRSKLQYMLDQRMETFYPRILDIFKWLPLAWLDRLLSRTEKNYRNKKALETVVISNMGRLNSLDFSCAGFRMDSMFAIPLAGSVFGTLAGVDGTVELTLNLPRVLASNGRFDALEAFLRQRLAE